MIDRVHFENFKSLGDVTIDLAPLTVLVGPNGCGKSSVLQAMHLLSQTGGAGAADGDHTLGRFAKIFRGPRDVRRLASERPAILRLRMHARDGDEIDLQVAVPAEATAQLMFEINVKGPGGNDLFAKVPPLDHLSKKVLEDARVKKFVPVVYLHLDAKEMVKTSVQEDDEHRMNFDGAGLATTLALMKGADEEELGRITVALAAIVPGVKRILTQRERVTRNRTERMTIDGQPVWRPVEDSVLGDRFAIEFDTGKIVPADLLSEGTVLALGLLTKLREPRRPKLFLLDDIDRGLHLTAQSNLIDALRWLMKLDPELQIVCTTHSPYLLDRFDAEQIRVMALDDHRRTRVRPLTDHPDFEKWRYGVQSGEIWASLGESWVASGAPAA